ncbi:MAG: CoA ester lyase [Pseudomonadota bacterium]
MTARPRRSILYMPGANPRALEKARQLAADGLIIDLEDSVAPDAKGLAREQALSAIAEGGYGHRELILRINGADTPWAVADMEALGSAEVLPDAVLLPKVSSATEVKAALAALDGAGVARELPVWLMAETPRCILNINEVAGADPRVAALVLGTSDLAKDTRVRHTPDRLGFIATLNLCVLAGRAHGLAVIDGVALDLEDQAALEASCSQGRDLGFDGKSLIHPKQIEAANAAFGPSSAEVAAAREVMAAFEEAEAAGKGVVVVKGRLVEALHVEEARHTLALAEAIADLS